jgi:hypothetical protein
MDSTRRQFLRAALAVPAVPLVARADPKARTVLLRSSWQTVNIGDVAHTPGVLRVLETHLPDVGVILWPSRLDRGVDAMLRRRFPKLRVVRDAPGWKNPKPREDDPTVAEAMTEADLMLHGSGPDLVGRADLDRWAKATGKPYGAYGVTLGSAIGSTDGKTTVSPELRRTLDGAVFVFTRETTSLAAVRKLGLKTPHLDFVPDGTFALDLRDDAAADKLLTPAGLEEGKFLCAVPRLRITPYWEIRPERKMPAAEIARRKAVNEKYAEADHAKLREAIAAWVRETGLKVLVCPEMTYQVGLIKPLVYDPLPADVKRGVVPMDRYWALDEAAAVYRRARAVLSLECHSPIIANAHGRPGLYLRQPTDTWKGQMYPDLGLSEWKIEIDAASGKEVADRVLKLHADYPASLALAKKAADTAAARFQATMGVVKKVLGQ